MRNRRTVVSVCSGAFAKEYKYSLDQTFETCFSMVTYLVSLVPTLKGNEK